jgi:hypothetical protein
LAMMGLASMAIPTRRIIVSFMVAKVIGVEGRGMFVENGVQV